MWLAVERAPVASVPQVTTDNTALIEIDFQHWILALAHDREVVDRAVAIRNRFCAQSALIVCTRHLSRDTTDPARSDPSDDGASFHPVLAPDGITVIRTESCAGVHSSL